MKHPTIPLLLTLILVASAAGESAAQAKSAGAARRDSVIDAAREIIGLQTYCALITVDSSGGPSVRTMNPFPPDSDMTVWIATNSRSRKAAEIRQNSRVCLYYADHGRASGYVAIKGRALLVDDMNEKLKRKRPYWDQAFPDWKYLVLIKVIPERLEVINYKRGMLNDTITWRAPSATFGDRTTGAALPD
ncbi:MAG TPA: pyridoxamine 5'-phosphate oxidase family protein [Bacteroidota bacterium]|nr:pyridoxamine 5'-phosphate oxidase family protein [Bacteroidota bacterium]